MSASAPQPMVLGKRVDDLVTLSKNRVLGQLGVRELGVLVDRFELIAIDAGTTLHALESDGFMYFVLEGHARARRGRLDLDPLGPSDHFGELALFGAHRRFVSIEALTPMRLARLARASYRSLTTSHTTIALRFVQALAESIADELARTTDDLALLVQERSVPRRAQVAIDIGVEIVMVPTGTAAATLRPVEALGSPVVAARHGHRPISLDGHLLADGRLEPTTLASADGREVVTRSLGLLLLEAAHRVAPGRVEGLGASITTGQTARLRGDRSDARALARAIEHEMRALVSRDVGFREELWSPHEASHQLTQQGWSDAASYLRTRREATVALASCGSLYALSTGPFLPRAGALAGLATLGVEALGDGLLLDFGSAMRDALPWRNEALARGLRDPIEMERMVARYDGEMAQAHRQWLGAMKASSIGELNEHCVAGRVGEIVRVAEGFHEKRIGQVADTIVQRSGVRVIAIAGPSSSGKTTFIRRLTVQLEASGVHPVYVSLDDYYLDHDKIAVDAAGERDYESLAALDHAAFKRDVSQLVAGSTVRMPRFDFRAGKSIPEGGLSLCLQKGDVLLVEGIHALAPSLFADAVDRAAVFGVFVQPVTTLALDPLTTIDPTDVRLLRRIVRDRHTRGYRAEENILRWDSVRAGEELNIFPHQPDADAVFDTSLVYELAVLKVWAERYLLEVAEEHPAYPTACRLRDLVDRFVAIDAEHVPPTSLLREFIGGSGFEKS
jgi:uridine kinase